MDAAAEQGGDPQGFTRVTARRRRRADRGLVPDCRRSAATRPTGCPTGRSATPSCPTCTGRRTSLAWWTWCPRSTRTTTSSSPTGAATPTSGCAPKARRSARCSATRPSAAWSSRVWSGAAITTSMSYSEEQNRHLSDDVNEAGGEVLLDQRVRRAGSHHQKIGRRAGGRSGTWRSPGASTCATPAATTPPTTATRRSCRWRRSTASAHRGTTSSSSCAARSSGCSTACSASAGTIRARSTPTTRSRG